VPQCRKTTDPDVVGAGDEPGPTIGRGRGRGDVTQHMTSPRPGCESPDHPSSTPRFYSFRAHACRAHFSSGGYRPKLQQRHPRAHARFLNQFLGGLAPSRAAGAAPDPRANSQRQAGGYFPPASGNERRAFGPERGGRKNDKRRNDGEGMHGSKAALLRQPRDPPLE
jgi:hypothetical protein